MKKINFSEKLDKIIKAVKYAATIVTNIAVLTLVADIITGLCGYNSFLSYGDGIFCCGVMYAAGTCMILTIFYSLVADVRKALAETPVSDEILTKAVDSDHGNDLTTVMEAIRNEPLEYNALFDINGRKLAEGTLNSPQLCNVPVEALEKAHGNVYIDLHNHPHCSQSSFSDGDYYAMIESRTRYMIVVTKSFNYIMENPYWDCSTCPSGNEVYNYAQDLFVEHVLVWSLFTRAYSRFVSRRVAKKFGFIYRIEHVRFQRFRNSLKQILITPRRAVATSIMAGMVILAGLAIGPDTMSHTNDVMVNAEVGQSAITKEASREDRRALCAAEKAKGNSYREMIARQSSPSTGVFQPEKPEQVDFIN